MKQSGHRALALATVLMVSPALSADEVTDQLQLGIDAYQAGELREAVQELQYAIAQIQEVLDSQYTKLLPAPLEGWTAEEPQAQSAGMGMMGGGTQISREYRNNATGESINMQIMADSPFLQAMSMMLSNPMMMKSDPNTKLYRHGRHRGMLKHQRNSQRWEISLMVANRILVQVTGKGMASKDPLEAYLKSLDLKQVEKAFGG